MRMATRTATTGATGTIRRDMGSSLRRAAGHVDLDRAAYRPAMRGHGCRAPIGACYGDGVPDISLPTAWSQTLPVVTVGGPVK